MPYADRQAGVYRIVNKTERVSYVGSSGHLLKRRAEHFRLLRRGDHPNARLQTAFSAHGADAFEWLPEVVCDELSDAREVELSVLRGDLAFEEVVGYNIAVDAFPMLGRTHTAFTKAKIAATKRHAARPLAASETEKLAAAQRTRRRADPEHAKRLQYIMDNEHLSYAERARYVGISVSSARKLFLRYAAEYGKQPPMPRRSYDRGLEHKLEYIRANPTKTLRALAQDLGCSATSISALVRRYQLR